VYNVYIVNNVNLESMLTCTVSVYCSGSVLCQSSRVYIKANYL